MKMGKPKTRHNRTSTKGKVFPAGRGGVKSKTKQTFSEKLEDNKNIVERKEFSENGNPYFAFIPYNTEITLDYLKHWVTKMIKEKENFQLYAQGFNFDGLYETNKGLIKNGVVITDNLTGEQRTIKVK